MPRESSRGIAPCINSGNDTVKADCKLLDLPVSGNKGQLFSRLQGYVDGTVRPKKKRRR